MAISDIAATTAPLKDEDRAQRSKRLSAADAATNRPPLCDEAEEFRPAQLRLPVEGNLRG